ncbi:MAG TPA: cation diffusion facilitator family transporter [Afifellaceae bacterium]|nr:cation diffusion facilitator family transporter [Afifellaceae bacterium]
MHDHSAQLPHSSRALGISAWLTGIYFIIELAIGIYTGSVAVLSDAFHTFSAVGGVLLAMVAARIAKRPSGPDRTFGWYRAEVIGALLNGAFLLAMAIFVIWMGAMRLSAPIDLPTTPMLIAAAGGLFTEFIALYLLYRHQGGDLNVRGAYWHIIQTFVGSVIIIVVAVVIRLTGFLLIDPLLGMAFGVVLLWASWGIMRDAVFVLMEGAPPGVDLAALVDRISRLDGVADVHHVHGWSLTSNRHVFSAHVRMPAESGALEQDELLKTAYRLATEEHGFFFATIQVETACLDETKARDIDVPFQPRSDLGRSH